MFYIWTAIKFLKKALVSLVLMKSFVCPQQYIPCGEGYFPPISDIVNSHKDSQGTCYSCCILFFSKGTRNPSIQHTPLARTWSSGCQRVSGVQSQDLSWVNDQCQEYNWQPQRGEKYRICPLHSCLASTHRLVIPSFCFSHLEIPALLTLPPSPPNSLLLLLASQWFPWRPGVWLAGIFFSVCYSPG